MAGWETLLAALGGLAMGAGAASLLARRHTRRSLRAKLEIESQLRQSVVPVLERRADALGVPVSARGASGEGPVELTVTLANAIRAAEENVELPFGDTVEVSRGDLNRELAQREGESA